MLLTARHQRRGQGRLGRRSPSRSIAPGPGLRRGGDDRRAAVRVRAGRDERQDRSPFRSPTSYKFKLHGQGARPPPAHPRLPRPGTPAARPTPAPPPATPRAEPVVNFAGVLRERGTRLPLAGRAGHRLSRRRRQASRLRGHRRRRTAPSASSISTPGDWKILIEAPGYYPLSAPPRTSTPASDSTSSITSSAAPTTPTTSPSPRRGRARR